MDCRHLDDLYELYLLGLLADEESGDLRDHLSRGCSTCMARLREAAETIYFFILSLPKGRPDRRWRDEIVRRTRRKA